MTTNKYHKREDVVEMIEHYIIENNINSGDRIPSERQLSELWNISRMTIRSAIIKLANENILHIIPGSGTYVAKKRLVINLQDTRGFYESASDDSRVIKTSIIESSLIEANKDLGQKMKLVLGSPIIKLVRIRRLDGVPVSYNINYLDASRFDNFLKIDLENKSLYQVIEKHYNVVPAEGEQSISITYCSENEARLLDLEVDSPVLFQSGITRDKVGRIFEHFKQLVRSDQVLLASELKRKETE